MTAIDRLDAWLRISPSTVLPAEVLEYLDDVKAENAKLRGLCKQMYPRAKAFLQMGVQLGCNDTLSYDWEQQMRELGIEVDE